MVTEHSKIERISEIIAFVIGSLGGEIYAKIKLVKLLYLIDVVFARRHKKNFSGITYKSSYYGPYSDDIEAGINLLKDYKYITIGQFQSFDGDSYYSFKLNNMPAFGYLTAEDRKELREIVLALSKMDLDTIREVAYNTKEYKQTDFNNIIQLAQN